MDLEFPEFIHFALQLVGILNILNFSQELILFYSI